jgi:hypothetical protein
MKIVLLESWWNVASHHNTCFEFCKCFVCILIKGKIITIMEPFVFQNKVSNYTFRKIMKFGLLASWLNLEAQPTTCFDFCERL